MADILKVVSPEKYYFGINQLKLVSKSDREWYLACPFHDDSSRSFSINRATGAWICFGACKQGGGILQFHMKKHGLAEEDAELDLKISLGQEKSVPVEKVIISHQRLLKTKPVLEFLKKRRGLSLDTIKRFEIGYDGDRIWIPIKVGRFYLNVRRYRWQPGGEARDKLLSYDQGYGQARLFPHENLCQDNLLICEGEMDCLLANQLGYHAVTVTGGAGTWPQHFTLAIQGKKVAICYDIDEAGRKGEAKVAQSIGRAAKEIKLIHLPISDPPNGDFTDYIVNHGFTKADFDQLLEKTELYKVKGRDEIELDLTLHQVALQEASREKYYLKRVEYPIIVSGKDLAPYFVPKKVKFTCAMGLKKCAACALGPAAAGGELEMSIKHPSDILGLIGVPDTVQEVKLKQLAGIVPCNLPQIEVKEAQNVEEVRVIPEIEFAAKDTEYVTRDIYVLGHGVRTNSSYTMTGTTVPEPRSQYATQVIDTLEPNQLSIDHFKMTPELKTALEAFQPAKGQSLQEKLKEIHDDLTFNITRIYDRQDILMAIDLVYHSVLQFRFLGRPVTKGWCEALVIGDTRCGKSETLEHIITHYRAGELVTGENTSFAGLIGGMQQAQQRWSISWGKIPLNDRRLVAIDEVSGLEVEQISLMSGVRSSGVAEIVKIQAEKTRARTRLIWASNPRSGRRLDTYNHGILAIKELIGRVEDIARFDVAVVAASGEVSTDRVFKLKDKEVAHKYTTELCNPLVLWAWSRTPAQVEITKEAEAEIFKAVSLLEKKYSSAIPLIEPAEQRLKLARLAVALAARTFSTEDGETVVVRGAHVIEVVRFLQQAFDKPSMGYDVFSAGVKKVDEAPIQEAERLKVEFCEFADWSTLRDVLLDQAAFRRQELIDQLGYDLDGARELFRWLGRWRLIKTTPIGYVKQPAFTAFLKSLLNGHGSSISNGSKKAAPTKAEAKF